MTRNIQANSHSSQNNVSFLARIVAVLLCPKSLDVDSVSNVPEENSMVNLSLQNSSSLSLQLSTESTDTNPETGRLTPLVIDLTGSPCSSDEIEQSVARLTPLVIDLTGSPCSSDEIEQSVAPFTLGGKRSCDNEAGPSRKRSVYDKAAMSSSTSSESQSLVPSLESDVDNSQPENSMVNLSFQNSSSPIPQLLSVESTDTTQETERLTHPVLDLTPCSSDGIEESFIPSNLCGKRFCDDEAGPSRKRSVDERATMFSSTSPNAQFPNPSLESDVDNSQYSIQPETFVSGLLERYDAIVHKRELVRVLPHKTDVRRIPKKVARKVTWKAHPHMQQWNFWVRIFTPCVISKHRQDGIAALAQLRHMVRRRGFMRFATELASRSLALRTDLDQVIRVREFMEAHQLLGEPSPLRVTEEVKWGPLRQLVETGECPGWLLHKALQDQIDAAGPLRPFLSFLAAAAEVYKGLPERVLSELEKEVEPVEFELHHRASLIKVKDDVKVQDLKEPGARSLLKLRIMYFDRLNLSAPRKLFLATTLSYISSLRYIKQWSPAETFALDLANALGVHLGVADELAEKPSTAGYWELLPLLTQFISFDNLPRSSLKNECKDLLECLNNRISLINRPLFTKDLDRFWSLAETLYEMITSPEALQAAIERKQDLVKKLASSSNSLLEEDPYPCAKNFVFSLGRPLVLPSTADHLPVHWHNWAAVRESVLPEGTSHRDMEAIVDLQLRPCVDPTRGIMHFISSIATVMWPREWFQADAVSSYDRLLEYFHDRAHLVGEGFSMFEFADSNQAKLLHFKGWAKSRSCNPVTLAAASANASLYNLLIRATNMVPHVKKEFTQRRLMLTSWSIPDFPHTAEPIKDPALNAFRAHAAHFLEPDVEFRKTLRILLSLRSFYKLNTVEQIVLDLAAALCVSLPGEPGHSPFWISAETFHSIMAKRPKWQQLFASPYVNKRVREASWLLNLGFLRLTARIGDICTQQAFDHTKQSKNFAKLLTFAQYVLEETEGECPLLSPITNLGVPR